MKVYILLALVCVSLCGKVKWVDEDEFDQVTALKYRTEENIMECLKENPSTKALLAEFVAPKFDEIASLVSKDVLEQCSKEPKVTSFEKITETQKCQIRCRRVGELVCNQKCKSK